MEEKYGIKRLTGNNWSTWKIHAQMLLIREDLWSVVEEDIPEEKEKTAAWIQSDRKAKATLILMLEDDQLSIVKDCNYAKEVYDTLKAHHEKTTRSMRVSLLKRMCPRIFLLVIFPSTLNNSKKFSKSWTHQTPNLSWRPRNCPSSSKVPQLCLLTIGKVKERLFRVPAAGTFII